MLDPSKPAFGPDAVHAFKAFQKAFIAEGKEVKYLQSGEMGGFNTFTPMLVAILSDKDPAKRIKMVDVDCNGRACPEMNTTLTATGIILPSPWDWVACMAMRLLFIRSATIPASKLRVRVYAVWHAYRFLHMGHEQGRDA